MLNTAIDQQEPRTFNLRRSTFCGYLGDFDVWTTEGPDGGQEIRAIHVLTLKIRIMPVFHARIMAGRVHGRSEFWRDALKVADAQRERFRVARRAARVSDSPRRELASKGMVPGGAGMVFVRAHLRRKPGHA